MEHLTLACARRSFPVLAKIAATLEIKLDRGAAIRIRNCGSVKPNLVQQKAGETELLIPQLNSHMDQLTGTAKLMLKQMPILCIAIRPCGRIRP